jgi:hypothetical protein
VKQDAILGHAASRGDRLPRAPSKDLWPHRVNRIGAAPNSQSRIFQCRRSKLADMGEEWINVSVIANSRVRRAGSRRIPAGTYVFWKTEEMILPRQANDPSGLKRLTKATVPRAFPAREGRSANHAGLRRKNQLGRSCRGSCLKPCPDVEMQLSGRITGAAARSLLAVIMVSQAEGAVRSRGQNLARHTGFSLAQVRGRSGSPDGNEGGVGNPRLPSGVVVMRIAEPRHATTTRRLLPAASYDNI